MFEDTDMLSFDLQCWVIRNFMEIKWVFLNESESGLKINKQKEVSTLMVYICPCCSILSSESDEMLKFGQADSGRDT